MQGLRGTVVPHNFRHRQACTASSVRRPLPLTCSSSNIPHRLLQPSARPPLQCKLVARAAKEPSPASDEPGEGDGEDIDVEAAFHQLLEEGLGDLHDEGEGEADQGEAEMPPDDENSTFEGAEAIADELEKSRRPGYTEEQWREGLEASGIDRNSMTEQPEFEGEDEQEELDAESSPYDEGAHAKYPRPPPRPHFMHVLFGKAAYYEEATRLQTEHEDVVVYGIQADPTLVLEGDLFCCIPSDDCPDSEEALQSVYDAIQSGAAALLLPSELQAFPDLLQIIPEEIAVVWVPAVEEVAARLAVSFFDAPSRDLLMVAVSGTRGKSTTSWLIRGILEEMEQVAGMMGSIEWSLAEDRLDSDGDLWEPSEEDPAKDRECSAPFKLTPYAGKYSVPSPGPELSLSTQKVLGGMKDRGATCCIFEVTPSSDEHHLNQAIWVDVNVVVHTTLAPPGGMGKSSLPMTTAQKEELEGAVEAAVAPFERLMDPDSQAAIINLDDPAVTLVIKAAQGVPHITYAIENQDAAVWAESFKFDIWESEIIVRTPLGRLQVISPLLGRHNVYNILAAVATGLALKVPLVSIVAGIESVEIIPGRCEVIDEGQDFSVIVDSADTPEALEAMLSALKGPANRIITVLGCRGEEDRSMRPRIAEVAHNYSDLLIFTNDSPCREPPEQIIQDMVAGLPEQLINRYSGYVYFPFQDQGHVPLWFEPYLQKAQRTTRRHVMEDRFSAIRAAIGTAQPGDVVLIAGRGHNDYMEYEDGEGGTRRGWFDDRVEARAALSKLAYLNQLTKLSRRELPWGSALSEMDTVVEVEAPPS